MSSNAVPVVLRSLGLSAISAVLIASAPLAAQDDAPVTDAVESNPSPAQETEPEREVIDIMITVPRGDVNPAQAQECEDRADAASLTGEIVVCRQIGEDPGNYFSGSRADAQKRIAEETAFKGSPRTPEAFGIPNHGNPIRFGGVPPPALIIDVEALPEAPAGSDADRVGRGLAPRGTDEDPSPEELRRRREALGLPAPSIKVDP